MSQALKRDLGRWRGADPEAMASQSKAAIFFAFEDAKHDILLLAQQRDELLAVLRDARDRMIGNGPALKALAARADAAIAKVRP